MPVDKAFLSNLLDTEEFNNLLDAVESLRPMIPIHTVEPDNTEEWKSKSANRNGFDLCFNQFRRLKNE